MAYEDSHTIDSTVAYVNESKLRPKDAAKRVMNMAKLTQGNLGKNVIVKNHESPKKNVDFAIDTLQETVKYPDEDERSDTDQNPEGNEGSLDPTVYYGSTDEEYDVDSKIYLDDTEEYVPIQESKAYASHLAGKQESRHQEKEKGHIIDHLSQAYLNAL